MSKQYKFLLKDVEVKTPYATHIKKDILHIGEYDETGKWLRWMPKEEFLLMGARRFMTFKKEEGLL